MLDVTNLKVEPAAETQVMEWASTPPEVFTALDSNKRLRLRQLEDYGQLGSQLMKSVGYTR